MAANRATELSSVIGGSGELDELDALALHSAPFGMPARFRMLALGDPVQSCCPGGCRRAAWRHEARGSVARGVRSALGTYGELQQNTMPLLMQQAFPGAMALQDSGIEAVLPGVGWARTSRIALPPPNEAIGTSGDAAAAASNLGPAMGILLDLQLSTSSGKKGVAALCPGFCSTASVVSSDLFPATSKHAGCVWPLCSGLAEDATCDARIAANLVAAFGNGWEQAWV